MQVLNWQSVKKSMCIKAFKFWIVQLILFYIKRLKTGKLLLIFLFSWANRFSVVQWIKSGQLVTLNSLHSSTLSTPTHQMALAEGGLWPSSPCVLFTGHPSCRLGPAVHLIRALAHGAIKTPDSSSFHHAIILTQTDDFLTRYSILQHLRCLVARVR